MVNASHTVQQEVSQPFSSATEKGLRQRGGRHAHWDQSQGREQGKRLNASTECSCIATPETFPTIDRRMDKSRATAFGMTSWDHLLP